MLSTTAFLAATMQCAASIHPSTALDVARVASGFNPYAIAEIIPKVTGTPEIAMLSPISPPAGSKLSSLFAASWRKAAVTLWGLCKLPAPISVTTV